MQKGIGNLNDPLIRGDLVIQGAENLDYLFLLNEIRKENVNVQQVIQSDPLSTGSSRHRNYCFFMDAW